MPKYKYVIGKILAHEASSEANGPARRIETKEARVCASAIGLKYVRIACKEFYYVKRKQILSKFGTRLASSEKVGE